MWISGFGRCALSSYAAAAMLAACAGSQAPIGAPAAMPRPSAAATHADRSKSWMLPEAKGEDLIYVPDYFANVVDVYSYPAGKAVGKLLGFDGPQGECVDTAGDVWITNEYSGQITEYAHGDTRPMKSLSDPNERPVDCSVDPTNGDLAVANFETTDSEQGTVSVYADAKGKPTLYSDGRQMFNVYFCGYDNKGDIFADGTQFLSGGSPTDQFQYAEIPKGSRTFTNLTLKQKIVYPGGIHWDGEYVAVGNLLKGEIYRTSREKTIATVRLKRPYGAIDFFVDAKNILVGLDSSRGDIGVWNYPSGGAAVRTLTLAQRKNPVALEVVSNKP